MKNKNIAVGEIVVSLCGHDEGGLYVVMQFDDVYAYICDGKTRKIAKPKKKKIKHIRPTGLYIDEINNVPQYAVDAAIRRGIKRMKSEII